MLCGSSEEVEGVAVQAISVFGHCITDKLQQSTSFLQQLVNSVFCSMVAWYIPQHRTLWPHFHLKAESLEVSSYVGCWCSCQLSYKTCQN